MIFLLVCDELEKRNRRKKAKTYSESAQWITPISFALLNCATTSEVNDIIILQPSCAYLSNEWLKTKVKILIDTGCK